MNASILDRLEFPVDGHFSLMSEKDIYVNLNEADFDDRLYCLIRRG